MAAAVTGAGVGGRYYAKDIEPNWLEIQHLEIKNKLVPKGFHGMKMIQFSDTHLGFQFQLKDLQEVISKINTFEPEILFFTGDLMDAPDEYIHKEKIIPLLRQLKAPLGKFCVFGNHDHGGNGSDSYREIMEKSGFSLLQNTYKPVTLLSSEKIYIAGIDEPMLGTPDMEQALGTIPGNLYTVLLSHAPDLADHAKDFKVQLQLSGHSHGGQIQIPFAGALVTPPYSEKYREGTYIIDNLQLHVNRGLGTTRLPYRFLSRPEITVYEFSI
ncbi:metallophosphoesterase [Bacillus massiliglaciei]|uniref:metallophosphoesterase n=1 Tax=Bacillus massiliglaciei TaxID=1816693 RepID=UPI000B21827F|nr:metallophosphoesterase [Bacillus massiliglaciei]